MTPPLRAFMMSLIVLAGLPALSHSQVPSLISFQGFATDDAGVPVNDASASIVFTLYRSAAQVWTETQTSITVNDGVFGVLLGSVVPLDTVDFSDPLELGINVNGDGEMSPRTPLVATPYALGVRGLDSLVSEIAALKALAEGPAILGASDHTDNGTFEYDSKTGIEAAYATCQDTYPLEPTAHLCSYDEVIHALSRGAVGDTSSYSGDETWTVEVATDHPQTHFVTLTENNCQTLLHGSGDIAVGSTLRIRFDYFPGGNDFSIGTHVEIDGGRSCNTDLPVLCCR